jgi:hypothetical protein
MRITFRPNRFGRSFGRKIGDLYDDYVKEVFVSACAINKRQVDIVLHTQEAWGSSPYAPTIKINKIRTILLTPYAPRRRSENQKPIECVVYKTCRKTASENLRPKTSTGIE